MLRSQHRSLVRRLLHAAHLRFRVSKPLQAPAGDRTRRSPRQRASWPAALRLVPRLPRESWRRAHSLAAPAAWCAPRSTGLARPTTRWRRRSMPARLHPLSDGAALLSCSSAWASAGLRGRTGSSGQARLSMRQISRDPFARHTLVREIVRSIRGDQTCNFLQQPPIDIAVAIAVPLPLRLRTRRDMPTRLVASWTLLLEGVPRQLSLVGCSSFCGAAFCRPAFYVR